MGVYWLLLIILGSYYFTTQVGFMDYLSVFIEMLQAKNLAPNTIRGYQTYLKPYLSYLLERNISGARLLGNGS